MIRELLERARQKIRRTLAAEGRGGVTERVAPSEEPATEEEENPGWEPSVELEDAPTPN